MIGAASQPIHPKPLRHEYRHDCVLQTVGREAEPEAGPGAAICVVVRVVEAGRISMGEACT